MLSGKVLHLLCVCPHKGMGLLCAYFVIHSCSSVECVSRFQTFCRSKRQCCCPQTLRYVLMSAGFFVCVDLHVLPFECWGAAGPTRIASDDIPTTVRLPLRAFMHIACCNGRYSVCCPAHCCICYAKLRLMCTRLQPAAAFGCPTSPIRSNHSNQSDVLLPLLVPVATLHGATFCIRAVLTASSSFWRLVSPCSASVAPCRKKKSRSSAHDIAEDTPQPSSTKAAKRKAAGLASPSTAPHAVSKQHNKPSAKRSTAAAAVPAVAAKTTGVAVPQANGNGVQEKKQKRKRKV
jgi:hypothetical protein